jgi:hypothetical protein
MIFKFSIKFGKTTMEAYKMVKPDLKIKFSADKKKDI